MSSIDPVIDELRAELAGLTGAARMAPLCRLGQALLQRFSFNGVHAPTSMGDLNDSISALGESLDLLEETDPLRASTAFLLGTGLSFRSQLLTDDDKDDTAAIDCFREALDRGTLPPVQVPIARLFLGSQHMRRIAKPGPMQKIMHDRMLRVAAPNPQPVAVSDIDVATECFKTVLADRSLSADIREMAELMLELTDVLAVLYGATTAEFNLANLGTFIAKFQGLQERFTTRARPGYGAFRIPDVFTVSLDSSSKLLSTPAGGRPVVVVTEPVPADDEDAPQPVEVEPEPAPEVQADVRKLLRGRLSLATDVPVWEAAAALLLPGAPALAVPVVDDAVAMASTIVDEHPEDIAPEDAAVDQFLLAVVLLLRHRLDPAGDADVRASADTLLLAARTVPADHPSAPVIVRSVGAFLDAGDPFGGVLERIGAGFAGRLDVVLTTVTDPREQANLHALRCVCRAAWAIADAAKAVTRLSPDYPWAEALRAAAGPAR
ncbi:hypothetical protein [Lentzea flaviverrucosa]|uniref:Uncharacterized protein n=1 Tax=Lentzea flaviverrucosa TaxID=200379 RepID=A0A1H9CDD0_9PSEU|nr:hypothetical protein [Lentzea flaviverrucosa]RDI24517.1 hypothetical protein DFR72_10997 [Lentzea flaviverrucosa]SEP99152.1 hypothetical protein SAMN05216195_101752 [Lentzea flaviverrucosa]